MDGWMVGKFDTDGVEVERGIRFNDVKLIIILG